MSPLTAEEFQRRARTKIVATIGPACSAREMIRELVTTGVDVFRINMAHGTLEEHARQVAEIHETSKELDRPVGILVDLSGPKIRLGELPGDVVQCSLGEEFRFIRGEESPHPRELVTTYAPLVDELAAGDRVMLADGTVGMQVIERVPDAAICKVTQAGTIRSRQGVNLPGVKLSTPAMTEEDREHATWAAEVGADFIGLSFVRSPEDVLQLKMWLKSKNSRARTIAKIEKPEALESLEEIVRAADGIMVARGDLGVEFDVARVPIVQKQIIAMCRHYQKPVITATQMLDSMHNSPRPTRAEASDVANAILDGTDACMLSGETAIGKYPREAVDMMNRIALATEEFYNVQDPVTPVAESIEGLHPVTEAVVSGASLMARSLNAKLIVVVSHSGATALAMAKQRNFVPTVGISDNEETLRQMCLHWGVTPVFGLGGASDAELILRVESWAHREHVLSQGDRVIIVSGTQTKVSGHNIVLVHEVR